MDPYTEMTFVTWNDTLGDHGPQSKWPLMLDCSDNGGNERYLAEQLVRSAEREDCYTARLVVRSVSPQDSDMYSLVVENLHGSDRFAIRLNVKGNSCQKPFKLSERPKYLLGITETGFSFCLVEKVLFFWYGFFCFFRPRVDGISDRSGDCSPSSFCSPSHRVALRIQKAKAVLQR